MHKLLALPLLLLPTLATASVPGLAPIPADLPARCEPLAHVPASALIPGPELSARVSVANCLAGVALDAAVLPTDDLVAPSLALLDGVIDLGDPYWVVVAEAAKRDLYTGMIVRWRRAHGDEGSLVEWQGAVTRETAALAEVVRAHPELAKRDVVIAKIIAREVGDTRVAQHTR